jgi:hypothetical protein
MNYNIEKINQIGKLLAEVVKEAVGQEEVLIGDVELALRESMRRIGSRALQCFLENADEEREAEIECACGGVLQYQRRRETTIWSVFGKMDYERAYYAGCVCEMDVRP